MEFPNRIRKHLKSTPAPGVSPDADAKPRAKWAPEAIAFASSERAIKMLHESGVPQVPPFTPDEVPGEVTLLGPFARSVIRTVLNEGLKRGVLHKVATYDVAGHDGIVWCWVAVADKPGLHSVEALVGLGESIQFMHNEIAKAAVQTGEEIDKLPPSRRDEAAVVDEEGNDARELVADARAWHAYATHKDGGAA